MVKALVTSRRFAPLFLCQFFAALNDNFVKAALVFLILFSAGSDNAAALVTLSGAVFIAPFFLLSALGGQLADKFDKALIARRLKLAEIGVAAVAALGFALQSVGLLMTALGLTGILSALFGPIKYGILPDHLEERELTPANALIEGATFAAILIGTVAGGLAASAFAPATVAAAMIAAALASYGAACVIPPARTRASELVIDRNPAVSTWHLIRDLWRSRRLRTGALIVAWFWLVGAVTLSIVPTLVRDVLGGSQQLVSSVLAVFVLGIAAGSLVAAKASRLRPNLGVVPLGALGMGLFALDLAWTLAGAPAGVAMTPASLVDSATGRRFAVDLFGIAAAGGMFIVPAFAAVQSWAEPDHRARVVAATNAISAGLMATAGLLVAIVQGLGAGFGALLLALGLANIAAAVLVLKHWGPEVLRDLGALVLRALHRVEVRGLENLPPPGTPTIIAPNHVSLLDGPLMRCFLPLDTVFAVDSGWARKWWVRVLLWGLPYEPVDPARPLTARSLITAVKAGKPLVIFPEGRITVTGQLMKVYDGTAMIAEKAGALVVPVRIEGAERSALSYLAKGQVRKALFPRITLTVETPVRLPAPGGVKGKERRRVAGLALQDVMTEMAVRTAMGERTLFDALSEAMVRRDTGTPILTDATGARLGYGGLIRAAQVLGRKLEAITDARENVGVMLPNSAAMAVTFFALQSIARVPAMLNFTAGAEAVAASCRAAQVRTILTSRAFVAKADLDGLVARLEREARIVYLEDVRAQLTLADKVAGALRGASGQAARRADDPAVILFTSGSEGTPKGVVLSHRNLLTNAAQAMARVDVNGGDRVFNVLPGFHAFGLTAGLIMPLMAGVPVFLYPSPLHYRAVPELIYQTNATILFGTNTFLSGYARAAHAYDFRSLRLILAGAEPVQPQTRALYMDRFGVRILEGYGVTEAAPVVALNTPLANRPGTVGRLSPLMEARLEPVEGVAHGGRLYVRGPNVMLGYLRAENPGVLEPPPAGWHDTGDIVSIDGDGFITIQGRARRFAKIGGEMISLAAVEALAREVWPDADSAAAAFPDRRKGERVVLVTTAREARREDLVRLSRRRAASELLVPAAVVTVERLPVLGSGKTDHVAVRALVERMNADAPSGCDPAPCC